MSIFLARTYGTLALLTTALLTFGWANAGTILYPNTPAQAVFDEVNTILLSQYGGLSQVNRQALRQEFQQRLNNACLGTPLTCPAENAYPVLEAQMTALQDDHSYFQTPEDFTNFITSATGGRRKQFGIKLARLDGENRVILEVLPGSAAEHAGLKRGDSIQTLDGEPYVYTKLRNARQSGKTLRLGIKRKDKLMHFRLAAQRSSSRDLPRMRLIGPKLDVAVLRIPTFLTGGSVSQTVHNLVAEANAIGLRGIIIDLRGNGGGTLSECDLSVSAFIPSFERIARRVSGETITKVSKAKVTEANLVRARLQNPQLWTGPMAVLVDKFSASCSEFFAHEVQYAKRGPIIGERTTGVGNTATRIFTVGQKNTAALHLTITHYVKPNGQPYPVAVLPDQPRAWNEYAIRRLSQGTDILLNHSLKALKDAPSLATQNISKKTYQKAWVPGEPPVMPTPTLEPSTH